jgi:two-component system OmpR family response regulator
MQRSRPVVLLVEDDREIARALSLELGHEGYDVQTERNGLDGLRVASTDHVDLVLLDVMLPDIDGIEVCRRLRARSGVPILMLTARAAVGDRVDGLDAGADDYLAKPFSLEELLARVRAALRRGHAPLGGPRLELVDLWLDGDRREAGRGEQLIALTPREFDLLEFLLRNQGQALTRRTIFENVWGYDFLGDSNVIDVYIACLRRKVDDDFEPKLVQTIRGIGYSVRAEP